MNAGSAETPPAAGWGWKKFCLILAFAFAAHLAFVFLLGAKKNPAPRAVIHAPEFQLADSASELVRLTDPTLFVLPHQEDFSAANWSRPGNDGMANAWTEPPAFLASPGAGSLGAAFDTFMQSYRPEPFQPGFNLEPPLFVPLMPVDSVLPQQSTWQLAGELAGRRLLNTLTAPAQAVNDIIAPSRVRLLVNQDGTVASTVLLESSGYMAADHYAPADQRALELARTLRFAPAETMMFGEIIFSWHTVPATTTNAP